MVEKPCDLCSWYGCDENPCDICDDESNMFSPKDSVEVYQLQMDTITEYLEQAYTGARMMDDLDIQSRLAKALAAFKADPSKDIFTQEFQEEYVTTI